MLNFLALILSRMFFKKILISGKPYRGKKSIWVVNHTNGIVDPTVLLATSPVLLRPLAKAPLWNNGIMRIFLKLTKAIPVARPQDAAEMSEYRKEHPDDMVAWQKQTNALAFKEVHKALNANEHILIFPEGLSHDDPFLHDFKNGVARMAVDALSSRGLTAGPSNQVTIQPVILDYSEKNEFRSALYIQYCEPVIVTDTNQSVDDIMKQITASFKKYIVEFRTWDEKRNWQYIFKMHYGRDPESLKEFHDFVEKNRNHIEQDVVLIEKIQTMRCMLQPIRISPCSSCWRKATQEQQNGWSWVLMFIVRFFSFSFITAPITLLLTLVWGIPLQICHFLGGSSKKYHRDVYATMTIAHGMWVLPLWASFISGVFTMLAVDYASPVWNFFGVWLLFFLFTPVILLIGLFVEENLNFCIGYFRFGLLKLTFPRGLEEMMREWKTISNAITQRVKE